jgi:DNA-binding response OmpR family regulator
MRKILVLDDNEDILQVVTEILTYERFEVCGIGTCAELLPLAENFLPDLILLDLRLTDGHGGELCRQIKSHPVLDSTPVIIFTAYLHKPSDLYQYGCDAVILKPFDLGSLLETINQLIARENKFTIVGFTAFRIVYLSIAVNVAITAKTSQQLNPHASFGFLVSFLLLAT